MHRIFFAILTVAATMLWGTQLFAQAQQANYNKDIAVSASKVGDLVIIDASLLVPASQRETWDVLVDYDHMAQFLPNLQSSKILSQSATQLRVLQKGGVTHGPLSVVFDVVRDVQLMPYQQITSHVIAGNLKKVDSTTRVTAEGDVVRVRFHSESIPNVWVPPGIGPALIESETREQFSDVRNEILRRKAITK